MIIKEFRVILPITVEEYQVAQLFSVAEASKNETGGGEGIEVLRNEPFDNVPLLGGRYNKGQYTYKIYHLASKVPAFIRLLAPKGALEIHEEAWNAYPYCKTVITDYKDDEDPTKFKSKKTGRGPLTGMWQKHISPVMCAYKLVTVEFRWFGLQSRVENYIQKSERRIFTNFHRQVFCWMDRWHGMTMEDIRALEDKTKEELDKVSWKEWWSVEDAPNTKITGFWITNFTEWISNFELGIPNFGLGITNTEIRIRIAKSGFEYRNRDSNSEIGIRIAKSGFE
uniref:Phosphatidylinositol transfer protein N-terminal domain-containing protein n=1 Tax=Strigamia maritima TaxID=126957 RepID=T1INR0_STRMM